MKNTNWQLVRGARYHPNEGVSFTVWAPRVKTIAVHCLAPALTVPMRRDGHGLHTVTIADLQPGTRYYYLLDGERRRPDPVSRSQPEGVHGPSEVIDPDAFVWTDHTWRGIALQDVILYELHPGTFTPKGTFTAILPYLHYLQNQLGVTAVELMPVAEFPGARNWGYDGVALYAPHSAYGGPLGLKTLVNACHEVGLAVALDVVYNHFGPEGNYLGEYGPYYTDRYHTPWGQAVNFESEEGGEVRRYIIDNALYWVTEYHIDILRLDAIHGIYDASSLHIVQELGEAVHAHARALGRTVLLIAESDLNDARVITDIEHGGWGIDAQWSDDFHHATHTLLTGEQNGYYCDFGRLTDLSTALTDGFVYYGQHSRLRGRPHGTPSRHLPGERFVICSQNHDQVGNRATGERLSSLVPFAALKVAAGLVLCAPNVPLLFMGEEYGETAPFLYFTSHTDPQLARAVSEGRRREFAHAAWDQTVPDPQEPETFYRSRLQHHLREHGQHQALLRFYRDLIALRRRSPALATCSKAHLEVRTWPEQKLLCLRRWHPHGEDLLLLATLTAEPLTFSPALPVGSWQKIVDAEAEQYGGSGLVRLPEFIAGADGAALAFAPFSFALYQHLSRDEVSQGSPDSSSGSA